MVQQTGVSQVPNRTKGVNTNQPYLIKPDDNTDPGRLARFLRYRRKSPDILTIDDVDELSTQYIDPDSKEILKSLKLNGYDVAACNVGRNTRRYAFELVNLGVALRFAKRSLHPDEEVWLQKRRGVEIINDFGNNYAVVVDKIKDSALRLDGKLLTSYDLQLLLPGCPVNRLGNFYTVNELAKLLTVPPDTIRRLLADQGLKAGIYPTAKAQKLKAFGYRQVDGNDFTIAWEEPLVQNLLIATAKPCIIKGELDAA